MASVYAVDAFLSPVGLLVAITSERHPYAPLIAAPLLMLLAIFARDRRRRIDQAIARLEELERERARLQGTIRRVGEAFATNLDRHAILALVVDTAVDALEAQRGRASADDNAVSREGRRLTGTTSPPRLTPLRRPRASAAPVAPSPTRRRGPSCARCGPSARSPSRAGAGPSRAASRSCSGISPARARCPSRTRACTRSSTARRPSTSSRACRTTGACSRPSTKNWRAHGASHGGEELAVLLRGTRLEGAFSAAEAIRRSIEALRIPVESGVLLRVTASVGIADLDRGEGTKNDLIAAADAALYEAKRSGKNRTVLARPGAGSPHSDRP
jgi:hypothetical protein